MRTIKNIFMALAVCALTGGSASAAVPDGYYDSLEGLSGVALKKAVKAVAREHTVVNYSQDTRFPELPYAWQVFGEADVFDADGTPVWWDMYSSNAMLVRNGHDGLNIEHCVPNSWWGKLTNDAYKDLFHLNPSDATANGKKSNYPPGKVANAGYDNGVLKVGTPVSGQGGGSGTVYEPADVYKGDFARAYFYIFTIYDDIPWNADYEWAYDLTSDLLLMPWSYELLLQWAKDDPVSQKEIDRNEVIYGYQNNRNPFIDNPELAEHIWGSSNNKPFHATVYTPGPEPAYPIDEVEDYEVLEGRWYAVKTADELTETDRYVIADVKQNKSMTDVFNSKYMEVCPNVATLVGEENPYLAYVPAAAAVITLREVSGGYAVGVNDSDGNFKGYLKSTKSGTAYLTQNIGDAGVTATITPSQAETAISFGSDAGKLQYNSGNPRFCAYTSAQGKVRLYRYLDESQYPPEEGEDNEDTSVEAVDGTPAPSLIGIYDVNGRRLNTQSLSGLDHGVYIVVTSHGTRKIAK